MLPGIIGGIGGFIGAVIPSGSFIGQYGSGTSFSINTGVAQSDRRIVAVIHWREGVAHHTLSSATIGGIAATIHVQAGQSGGSTGLGVAIISAIVPSGTTATLATSFSGSVDTINAGVWRLVGYTTLLDSDAAQASGSTAPLTIVIDTAADGVVIGGYTGSVNTTGTNISWTNMTEQYDIAPSTRQGGAFATGVSAGTLSVGATQGIIGLAGNDLCVVSWSY